MLHICKTDLLRHHSTDWIRRWEPERGEESWLLLRPANAPQVAQVVKYCHNHDICIVPQGGNTGMVGGSTPVHGSNEVILSLSRMNRIQEMNIQEGMIDCEAGCTLEALRYWMFTCTHVLYLHFEYFSCVIASQAKNKISFIFESSSQQYI